MDIPILWLPVILVVTVLSFVLAVRLIIHRERMELIKRGMIPHKFETTVPSNPHLRLYIGAVTTAVGLALTLGMLTMGVGMQLVAGLVPLFAGLAILLIHLLSRDH